MNELKKTFRHEWKYLITDTQILMLQNQLAKYMKK